MLILNTNLSRLQAWFKTVVKWTLAIWFLFISITGTQAQTVTGTTEDNLIWSASNGQVAIIRHDPNGPCGSVTIPSTINVSGSDLPVTSIAGSAFLCTDLSAITIPNSVTSIGDSAFQNCSVLTSVTIPNSVTSIGNWAFAYCLDLTSMAIPNSVTSIGYCAFDNCSNLTSVTIGKNVASIGQAIFVSCPNLLSISVDPGNIFFRSLNGALFSYDQKTLLAYPTASGSFAIPGTVTKIVNYALAFCTNLTSVTIPSSVTSIGSNAFNGCSKLNLISVDAGNPSYSSVNNVLFDKLQTTLIQFPGGFSGTYVVPNGVTSIGNTAFEFCSGLTSVTIPNSVTSIGISAFYDCSSLTSVTIPSSVTSIGTSAFQSCNNLKTAFFIGNSPSSIGDSAFSNTATGFILYYYSDKTGFTPPTWNGYPCVSVGYSPCATWLVSKGFSYTTPVTLMPNRDGVSLLMSYALNLDPTKNQSRNMPKPYVSGSNLYLTYYASNADVTYAVQTGTDMKNWTISGVTTSGPDGNGCYTASIPMGNTRRFMRLVVTH